MQTFLPYEDFVKSAKCLDNKRLGKQRVEAKQIYNALTTGKGWVNHPATKMWLGYENTLLVYTKIICEEWISRGFKDTVLDWCNNEINKHLGEICYKPSWLGNEHFHYTHRCNLVRKLPEHYEPLFGKVDATQKYAWFDMDKQQWFYKTGEMKHREYLEEVKACSF